MRQRGKYFQCFLGNPLLFVASHVAERPHIMKPVCQFYDDDADIFCHGQEHFTHAVELLVFFCTIIKPAQFRYAIDQKCDFLAELGFDIIQRQSRVFHYVMKKRSRNGRRIDFHFCQYLRHCQRVDNIRFTTDPVLIFMSLICNGIGFFYIFTGIFRLITVNRIQ